MSLCQKTTASSTAGRHILKARPVRGRAVREGLESELNYRRVSGVVMEAKAEHETPSGTRPIASHMYSQGLFFRQEKGMISRTVVSHHISLVMGFALCNDIILLERTYLPSTNVSKLTEFVWPRRSGLTSNRSTINSSVHHRVKQAVRSVRCSANRERDICSFQRQETFRIIPRQRNP